MTSPIQPLLITLVCALGLLAMARLGKPLASRSLVLGLMVLGVWCVIHPEDTTKVARQLGVGRGTDLIIYLGSLTFSYLFLLTHLRMLRAERQIRLLVREIAIQSARYPDKQGAISESAPEEA